MRTNPSNGASALGGVVVFPLPGGDAPDAPRWTGHGFDVGGKRVAVLATQVGRSGWSDDLTRLHESSVGSGHYIDVASRTHAVRELTKHVAVPSPVIMEIGCSSGFFLRDLRAAMPGARIMGADYVVEPLERLARDLPDLPLLQFDLTRCPLPDDCLDGMVLLNVLEHIEDDGRAVREVARVLKPGAVAVIEVPAGPGLFDVSDKQLQHYRRYTLSQATALARAAGLEVMSRSHLGFFLWPAFAATKKLNRRYLNADEATQRRIFAKTLTGSGGGSLLLHWLMRVEEALRPSVPMPVGIRCLLTCRKPSSTAAT